MCINCIDLKKNSRKYLFLRQSGFILLHLNILLAIFILLYIGLSAQLLLETQIQHKQIHYIKSMNKNISALNRAPYLQWYPADEKWQCQQVEQKKVCIRQSGVDPKIVLLRIGNIQHLLHDNVMLYRFVRQQLIQPTSDNTSNSPKVTLLWINGCWYDACPEKNITLCQG